MTCTTRLQWLHIIRPIYPAEVAFLCFLPVV